MSREVRRVPLDFDAPLNEDWVGYIKPEHLTEDPCPDCCRGATWAAEWLNVLCNRIDMLASDIAAQDRGRNLHPWLALDQYPASTDWRFEGPTPKCCWRWSGKYGCPSHGIAHPPVVMRPTEDIVPLIAGLIGETEERTVDPMRSQLGHRIAGKLIAAAGLDPQTWGACVTCEGRGSREAYDGQRAEAEAWTRTEPPTGEGWQLWETVSDGSPISPVFATPEGLAEWMADPARGDEWLPLPSAQRFIEAGWAPSGVGRDDIGLVSGVEFMGFHASTTAMSSGGESS